MSGRIRTSLLDYGSVVAVVAAATGLRMLLDPFVGDRLPFITYFPAVAFSAWYRGLRPALFTVILSAAAASFFVIEPRHTFAVAPAALRIGLVLFVILGLCITLFFESLRRAQDRAVAAADVARAKQQELEAEIEQRQRVETELRRQREWFYVTLNSIGDAVLTTDTEDRVTFLNQAAQALTGWPAADAHGQPLGTVFRIVNEQTRQPAENPVRRALRDGRVVGLANNTILISKDGTERAIEDSAAPIRSEKGVAGVVLVFRDVTARRRADEALRKSREQMALVTDHAPVLLAHCDAAGRYLFVNRPYAERFGLRPEDVIGKHIAEVVGEAAFARFRPYVDAALAGAPVTFEAEIPYEGIEPQFMQAAYAPERDAAGRVVGLVAAIVNVTDRRRAEEAVRTSETRFRQLAEERLRLVEELKDTDRRKDEFLAMLAHELRNPLAPIRNAVQVLRMAGPGDGALQHARDLIDRQVSHLVRLVDDLLDVSRITRGKINLRSEPVDLAAVVASAVESSRPLIDARRHDLALTLPDRPALVMGDLTRLSQVVLNLLNNSAKYTPEGGKLALTVERHDSQAVIRVRDNGVGIAPELLAQVFDIFTQAERTLDRAQGGLGLGLTLVRKLVEMHGGSVAAASRGLGQGSEFVVRLPLADLRSPMEAGADEAKRESPNENCRLCKVLVVDDNVDAADSLALLLRLTGNEVRTAYDGPNALQAAEEHRPDVIFLDIGLPGMDGYEVGRRLRQQPGFEQTPLVAVTGYGSADDRRRSDECGFYAHLVKPVSPADVEQLLARLKPAP